MRSDLRHLGPEFYRNPVWKIPFFWTFAICPSGVRSYKNLCIGSCTVFRIAGRSEAPAKMSAGEVGGSSNLRRLFCRFSTNFRIFLEAGSAGIHIFESRAGACTCFNVAVVLVCYSSYGFSGGRTIVR